MWIGFSNPTFQPFPNFRNVWTSVLSSDTSIRPTSKPKNPCRSDSRIRHFNHSRIFAICEHRFFRRIPVSDLRRNRTIHVDRILESDISIIPEFSQGVNIVSFVGYTYPTRIKTEKSMWVGFSNPTFQSFPNFCNIWTSAFLVGYQYPTYVETEKSM